MITGESAKGGAKRSTNARLIALAMIASVLDQGRSLADFEAPDAAEGRSVAYARHIAYGVLRWLNALEWLAGALLQRPLKQRDRDLQRLILIGLYQLWKDGSPPHAAIHEAVEGARQLDKAWATGMVNAVLRRFQREQNDCLERLERQTESWAHPAWLLDRLQGDWPQDWQALVNANNRAAPLWLRMNGAFAPQETIALLEAGGFTTGRHPFAPDALKVTPAAAVQDLPGFAEGRFSVQDPAAQLAVDVLAPAGGERVLDACAAPGGKSGHILERSGGVILTALDLKPARLERVADNLRRLRCAGRENLRLLAADAAQPDQWWDGEPFARILLDAPCTATGVIRRHPEIKWLRTQEQLQAGVALQRSLLLQLWPLLEPGGMLVYATCSVLRDENERQMEWFLGRQADAELVPVDGDWGRDTGHGRQILPGEQEMDGFFYARLRKRS
ncbi:MAG: 16S rRNA (cytosine(967)-C(5))-methyltransferase RsmB [Xanthomonadales bacterium]|nr:16S rRNA (cytosine(967)-C(5))-methyltransferase RsmB [Xanthomonadales bacterium]